MTERVLAAGTGIGVTADATNVTVAVTDAELLAIAGLTSAADRLPYFTGSGTASLATFTAAGRAIVDDADAAAQRTTLGLAIGTDVQAHNAYLADLAAITPAQGDVLYFNGTDWVALGAGTSGNFLKTNGAAANPAWGAGNDVVPVGASVRIEAWDVAAATSGAWTLGTSTNYIGNAVFYTSSGDGSYAEWTRYLTAGTYTLTFLYAKVNDAAIVDLKLDGTNVVTGLDTYAASASYNNRSTTTGIVVGSSGAKTMRIISNGKNASSSGYAIRLHSILWTRTA